MKSKSLPNKSRNIVRKLLLIILISILIGAVVYYAIILWAFPAFSEDWHLLEGFTSVISLALLAGGLTFAVTEYTSKEDAEQRENAKLSYDIYKAIFDKLTDPEQEAARRWILTNITIKQDDEDIAAWYNKTHAIIMKGGRKNEMPEGQKAVKLTLNCFDYIGFIALHYWKIEADSLDWISAPIAKVWRRLGPYVEQVRILRNTTDFYTSAEHVGKLCITWRNEKGMDDEKITKNTI